MAVSVSSASDQIVSAIPALASWSVWIAVGAVFLITIGNLRGLREAGNIFAIPTYLFLGMALLMIGLGAYQIIVQGVDAAYPSLAGSTADMSSLALVLLAVRAFSAGSVGLTGTGASFEQDYTEDDSAMAKAISCFNNSSGQGTDIADPVRMATYELEKSGRPEAVKAILLLSDGKPNNSATPATKSSKNFCLDAYQAATAAKAKGIEVYTVGFGLDVEQDHIYQDTYGDWKGKSAPDLLAAIQDNPKPVIAAINGAVAGMAVPIVCASTTTLGNRIAIVP